MNEQEQAALNDRRQLALETGLDKAPYPDMVLSWHAESISASVETATRVKITDEVIALANRVQEETPGLEHGQMRAALGAAFRAAGFEVEQ